MSAPRRSKWLLRLMLVLSVSYAASALAQQQVQPSYYAKPPGVSLEQAADMVRRQTGGRVLSATPVTRSGRRGYNIRVLLDGKRVKQYYVDSEGRMSAR